MSEQEYYLVNFKGKYMGQSGLVDDKTKALKFSIKSIKNRFKIAHNAKLTNIISNIRECGYIIESDSGSVSKNQIIIKGDYNFNDNDIVYCNAIFYYDKEIFKKEISFCVNAGAVKGVRSKGDYDKVEIYPIKKVGESVIKK